MTDPTPIRPPAGPRLGEAVVHLDQVTEVAEVARRSAGQALLAQLNDRPDLALMSLAATRSSVRLARAALDAAQLAVLGIEPDPEADLAPAAPVAAEVTDEDIEAAVEAGDEAYANVRGDRMRAALETFARRLAARGAGPAEAPQLDPPAARLVITAADVEACGNHYSRRVDSPADALGIRAALEAYARRIELGLAVGTTAPVTGVDRVIGEYPPATIPAGTGDEWAGTVLEAMYGGADAPRCATCSRPYSQVEAAAGMTTCEHCPPPAHPDEEGDQGDEDDGSPTTDAVEHGTSTYSDPAVRAAIRDTLAGGQ